MFKVLSYPLSYYDYTITTSVILNMLDMTFRFSSRGPF